MEGKMRWAPIIMYGKTGCEDTDRSRMFMQERGIPFREVNIDHDPEGEFFVRFLNQGARATPTIVIGDPDYRVILVEPDNARLEEVLRATRRP